MRYNCPNPRCGQHLDIDDLLGGQVIQCPKCGFRFILPKGGSVAAPEPSRSWLFVTIVILGVLLLGTAAVLLVSRCRSAPPMAGSLQAPTNESTPGNSAGTPTGPGTQRVGPVDPPRAAESAPTSETPHPIEAPRSPPPPSSSTHAPAGTGSPPATGAAAPANPNPPTTHAPVDDPQTQRADRRRALAGRVPTWAPPAFSNVRLPVGNVLAIENAALRMGTNRQLTIELRYSWAPSARFEGPPDHLAVFYVTRYANLDSRTSPQPATSPSASARRPYSQVRPFSPRSGQTAAPPPAATDASVADSIAQVWSRVVSMGSPAAFSSRSAANQIAGGVGFLTRDEGDETGYFRCSGRLVQSPSEAFPLDALSPPALGLVLYRRNQPLSAVYWLPAASAP